ncbi:hypothetical protein [Sphingobium sp. YR768]|uniref:hypothetical protein n=1 Tax=Sphingobium sp. YR768 TaxID=1884365 RepID=UPI0008D1E9E0|nr:hypothetical protein [Sphingobium sp. YR768]SER29842.1 Glycosyl hydrolase family 79, N-terminal domain [Sphingobium sp. YR768]
MFKRILKVATLNLSALCSFCIPGARAQTLDLANLKKTGEVSERYQAYNVEMVEVTGGRFWAAYENGSREMYRYRPPVDLTNRRLINLARHLGPSLVRVSGSWANSTYLEEKGEKLTAPPAGYKQILTRTQWRNVVAFSLAVDAPIVTSFAVSAGVRGPDGVWASNQAQRVADLTKDSGGKIFAAEFFNEPNMPETAVGLSKNYGVANYAADFRTFRRWAHMAVPDMKILGPGGVGEGGLLSRPPVNALAVPISTEGMMKENPGSVDVVSYHFYGAVSERCAGMNMETAVKEDALTAAWLDGTLREYKYYAALRDRYEPGKPMWITEAGQAACGGSRWASTFLDSFRYLNQLGALAQLGVKVVMHNTLAASDYGLIDGDTLEPRPDYWAALLWNQIMDKIVLESPRSPAADLRLYAHCLPGGKGGVGLLALNLGAGVQSLAIGKMARAWVMTGKPHDAQTVMINGKKPVIDGNGNPGRLVGTAVRGSVPIAGRAIAFVAVPDAGNPACR